LASSVVSIGEPLVKYVESMFMPYIGCEHSYI